MNREEFMRQLESLLQNISPTERAEAIQYYNDYFDDAGPESEQSVIEALGTPAKVAENIKRDIYGSGYEDNSDQSAPKSGREIINYQEPAQNETSYSGDVPAKKDPMPTWAIVLLVILCVLASPALLGLAGGIFGTVVGILAIWFALIVAFAVIAVTLIAVLFALVAVGIMCLFVSPLTGAAVIGIGLFCGGVGILFLMLTVAMAGIATPAIIKGIIGLCKKIFKRKEAAA